MKKRDFQKTAWMQSLMRGEQPTDNALREHLLSVHKYHPGFSVSCSSKCRDDLGRNSYESLASLIDPDCHSHILDLACGSGALLAVCRQRCGPNTELSGVDMSAEELMLARRRNSDAGANLYEGLAQDLFFIDDDFFDVVLCHWALTLMDQVPLVLKEVRRVLKDTGIFAAIVDGRAQTAPGYAELNEIIYSYVRQHCPQYGGIDLGDPRVREGESLERLVKQTFAGAEVKIESEVFYMKSSPKVLASEVAGFFYASYVLNPEDHNCMLQQIESFFEKQQKGNQCKFSLPVNKLVVRHSPDIGPGNQS